MIQTTEKVFEFLERNGFKRAEDSDYIIFCRDNDYAIDFDKNTLEFTILAEEGDILTIPFMKNPNLTKYMIIGYFTLFPARGSTPRKWKK